MACPETPKVAALEDRELGPAEAAALSGHVAGCAECREAQRLHREIAQGLRARATRHRAPAALRARIAREFASGTPDGVAAARGAPPRRRAFWLGAGLGALAAGLVAVAIVAALGRDDTALAAHDVALAHLRALQPGRAVDVESSERHTVKPWFAGRADVSPPVVDFAAEGFALLGGRIDFVAGTRAAVVVYRHNAHLIDVFAWRAGPARIAPGVRSEGGYRLVLWRAGDLAFCAVSDTAEAELQTLKGLLNGALPADARE